MSVKKFVQTTSPLALAVMLVACDSGTAVSPIESNATEPVVGSGDGANNPAEGDGATEVNGRVADGYILGATVCVDVNENDSCDSDEPSALTGAGGSYKLSIPAAAQGKPVVADIPAEAIDEDTGETVGLALVFIAPADRPEFISPITTLVHHEIKSNPSLDINDAENAVKTILGIDEDDVSLFTDYVAGGTNSSNTELQDEFRFLHDTARVVASMMKDIETQVDTAAQSNGLDVAGSKSTQQAIRDIVRQEVRQLLPDIAWQVAQVASNEKSSVTPGTDTATAGINTDFDPDQIAISLRPEDVTNNISNRIDAVVERAQPIKADMKTVLTEGVYWMEFDCDYNDHDVDGQQIPQQTDSASLEDDTANDTTGSYYSDSERKCDSIYGTAKLTSDGSELTSSDYRYDTNTGVWVEILPDVVQTSDYVLVNGEWQQYTRSGPQGEVSFLADGSAVIENVEGDLQLNAVYENLDASEILDHLWSGNSDPAWIDRVKTTDLFPSGSVAYRMSVKQTTSPYVMFNTQSFDDSVDTSCVQYFDNCNVVGSSSDAGFSVMSSLTDVQAAAVHGLSLSTLHSGFGPTSGITLMVEDSNSTLPTSGTAKWEFNAFSDITNADEYNAGTDMEPDSIHTSANTSNTDSSEDPASFDGCKSPSILSDTYIPTDAGGASILEGDRALPTELELLASAETDQRTNDTANTADERLEIPTLPDCNDAGDTNGEKPEEQNLMYPAGFNATTMMSTWKLVEVDGLQMVEIKLPDMFRFDGGDTKEAMLLIEHDGFIRLGARMPDSYIDLVVTYNETAFTTLRSIIENSATD